MYESPFWTGWAADTWGKSWGDVEVEEKPHGGATRIRPRKELPAYAPPVYVVAVKAAAKAAEYDRVSLIPVLVHGAQAHASESESSRCVVVVSMLANTRHHAVELAVCKPVTNLDLERIRQFDEELLMLF